MPPETLTITTAAGSYPIVVGAGLLAELPARLAELGLRGRVWLISDSAVFPHYGAQIEGSLRAAGYAIGSHVVPSGEASKDLAVVAGCYDWLIGGAVERRHGAGRRHVGRVIADLRRVQPRARVEAHREEELPPGELRRQAVHHLAVVLRRGIGVAVVEVGREVHRLGEVESERLLVDLEVGGARGGGGEREEPDDPDDGEERRAAEHGATERSTRRARGPASRPRR